MVSLVSAVGLLVIVAVHTAVAAVVTRFFRVRLDTEWGATLYAVVLLPILLTASTLVLSGGIGLGADLGSQGAVVTLVIALPLVLGYSVDVFWMPHPDDVELPDVGE